MKKLRFIFPKILVLWVTMLLVACSSGESKGGTMVPNEPVLGESNVLVAYFSWSASHKHRRWLVILPMLLVENFSAFFLKHL